MTTRRSVFGTQLEQPYLPLWLFAFNKSWMAALGRWHHLTITGDFPKSGPVLVVSNHVDAIDPCVVGDAVMRLGGRSLTMLARSEFFAVPLLGWWMRNTGAIPIKRDQADLGALRAALSELKQGHIVGTFPQATRAFGRQGRFGEIKSGAAYLAAKAGVPVVAVGLTGTDAPVLSRGKYEVRFSEPFMVPPLPRRSVQADVEERVKLIEERMLELLPAALKRDRISTGASTTGASNPGVTWLP